jgi:hypothetical protein
LSKPARLLWFFAIYGASVVGVAGVAFLLKAVLRP